MHRRQFIRDTSLSLGALALLNNNLFASLLADPAFKIRMLRNDVGIFSERGGTIGFLLSKKGIVVIDTQFPEQAGHFIEEMKKQERAQFKLLINTHHHGDHSSGNIAFKGLVPKVVAHANSLANQQRVAKERKTEDKQLYPDTTFTDTWKQKVGKERIKIHYFGAGHTNGDSIIHFEHANIAHMGDLLFNGIHPFVDKSSGASMGNWINVIDKTISTFNDDTIFIFGHAADPEKITGNREDLKVFKNYLEKVLEFVGREIKAGKTKEEVLKTTVIPGLEAWKADGIQRPLGAAYDEISTGK
jgi:cyclase